MKKTSFFKTEGGELCIAGALALCALPTIIIGIKMDSVALAYIGVGMIVLGMLFSPLRKFVFKRKD